MYSVIRLDQTSSTLGPNTKDYGVVEVSRLKMDDWTHQARVRGYELERREECTYICVCMFVRWRGEGLNMNVLIIIHMIWS